MFYFKVFVSLKTGQLVLNSFAYSHCPGFCVNLSRLKLHAIQPEAAELFIFIKCNWTFSSVDYK
uniref:Uncharacterized protein n=1 Tax=Aegilops tauschii subsp. strangulata TaxID=200361 RepID=A0A453J2Y5_AEGTS